MPYEWTDNLNIYIYFFFTVQFYQTCRIPGDETKKVLGPKINPPTRPALYVCGTTPIRLFWIPFEIPTYIKPPKVSIDIYIFQIFLSPKKSRDGKFQTKKKSLDHLSNFNFPLPLQPPPRAGPRVRYYCLRCSFWLLVVVQHFSLFLCLSWFLSVWKYPEALCSFIAICCIRTV